MGLGMPEVVLILVIALIVFGPRKLPELGKSLGQAMGQFRKASDEFKRTWEQEVEFEKVRKSDTTASTDSQSGGYGSSYHNDSDYGSGSDYNYGYDNSTATTSTDSLTAAETADQAKPAPALPPAPSEAAAVSATEKKPEPHWI